MDTKWSHHFENLRELHIQFDFEREKEGGKSGRRGGEEKRREGERKETC